MKSLSKGFGIMELMISLVISSIVIVFVYKSVVKGTHAMSDRVKISEMKTRSNYIFEAIANDIEKIGYNPDEILDENNLPMYGLRDLDTRAIVTDNLKYTYYNSNPKCTSFDPVCPSDSIDCSCERYSVNDGVLTKEYFDTNEDRVVRLVLLTNVCVKFYFWDTTTDRPQTDQTQPSPLIKLLLGVAPGPQFVNDFDSFCHISGSVLEPSKYVRLERLIKLDNLF